MDGWHPGLYDYDPYTNTFLPLTYSGYGFGVEYSWNPAENQQGPMENYLPPYSSTSPLLPSGRQPRQAAARGRGRGIRGRGGRLAQRGRGGGRRGSSQPRQHGGPGLLGSDPSNHRPPPPQLPRPRRSATDELSSSQPPVPAPLPPEDREPTPPPPPDSSSPSSDMSIDAMTPPDPVKDSHSQNVDVSMTAADDNKMMDDVGQDDVSAGGLGGSRSSTSATDKKKRLLPLDPPAAPMKTNSDGDVSMAHRDDDQGDVLGLNEFMAKKRLLSGKVTSLATTAADAEEEAKAAARKKKTRLSWGQGLAKYENRQYKKDDDETTHKLVAHDGATGGEAASSLGSSPPPGSKGDGDNKSLADHVTNTAPDELFSKGTSLTAAGDLGNHRKNRSKSSLTEKAVSTAEVPARSSHKPSPSPAADNQNLMADGGFQDRGSTVPKVSAVHRRGSPPPDDNCMKLTKVQDIPPRTEKVIVKMVQKPKKMSMKNVLSEEPKTDDLQGSNPKEWSQEEKDLFSEMITKFGMHFSKVSSFLIHKTTHDCIDYYYENYIKSECHKEAQKCLTATVIQSQENCCNENDAAPLVSGIATVTATKNYGKMSAEAEDVNKSVNQICHESTANLLAHSFPDKGHGESSMDDHEHVTEKVLVGDESNNTPSQVGMISSQAACLTIPKTEAAVLEKFTEDSCSNEAVCITKSSSMVNENVPQSVLIANLGDEGHCVAAGSCGHDDSLKLPDESCAKVANGTIKGDQVRSGAKTPELCSSLKEYNGAAKHYTRKATEMKLANSNIEDGRKAPSDKKNPNVNPRITSDPAMLTGPEFVQHMKEFDEAMEKKESEENYDKVQGKEGNNPVICVASKHCSGIQLSCEVGSQKEMEKVVDSISMPEGNDLNEDMENPTKDSSPRIATNASIVRDDGLVQRLRDSDAMYKNSENNDDEVISMKGNPMQSVDSTEGNGIKLRFTASEKGKGIIPVSPEVNDLINAPHMQISNEAPKTYHLPSSSGCAALDKVDANSSYVAMDIDLNIPLDVTPLDVTLIDLEKSIAEASMGRSSEETDSEATIEMIISPSQTTATVSQTVQQQLANQPGSIVLFGHVIHTAPSTAGTTNHTHPNQGNQTVLSNVLSNPVFPEVRRRGPDPSGATATNMWRGLVPNNQQSQQQAVLSNRMPYGGSTNGASSSSASQLQLQPRSSALLNLVNQQRQQALANITPYSIMRGTVPSVVPSHLMPGSSGGAGFVNFSSYNSAQQQWPFPILGTSTRTIVFGHPFYFPGANANQAPATATNMPSTGTNNGEGASTSNTRAAPPGGGRGRGRGRGRNNSWLSLRRN